MTTVNGSMSAEQFFWSKIDKNGTGKIDNLFEIADAEGKGFVVKDGMTEEEFIAKNKKAIQKRALFDIDYSNYQLEQAKRKQETKQKGLEEKLSKVKEEVSKLGPKPDFGADNVAAASGTSRTEKVDKQLNTAQKMLEDVANGNVKVKIEEKYFSSINNENDTKVRQATLPDGRVIMARYDDKGEIDRIYVCTDITSGSCDVEFKPNCAQVSTSPELSGYDVKITDGYNFEQYKQLAERIFG